jgi:hypothetical protein
MVRGLIDPHTADLQSPPRDARDLIIGAHNTWVVGYDNLSTVSPEMSDSMCRLATGEAFTTRTLYSDTDQTILKLSRPILLNGIAELATRPDLLERSLGVVLPTIPPDRRKTEGDLWADYNAARPRILGALLSAVSDAIENLPMTRLEQRPRMADFAEWITAAEGAFSWEPGSFATTYTAHLEDHTAAALEGSAIGDAVVAMATGWGEWTGTASDLLNMLTQEATEQTRRRKDWPATPQGLSGTLRRLAPALRQHGVEVTFNRSKISRTITLTSAVRAQAGELA